MVNKDIVEPRTDNNTTAYNNTNNAQSNNDNS